MTQFEAVSLAWRGSFANAEANALHAEAFETEVSRDDEWDWWTVVQRHSLGWVVARVDGTLVGFVNVAWDGLVHAWLQDLMVAVGVRGTGVGRRLVSVAADNARRAGCEWLHADFEDDLASFYFAACEFTPTKAGLLRL